MTARSRRSRTERRRDADRERARRERGARRRTGVRAVDTHASWREVYRALDAALSIEPEATR